MLRCFRNHSRQDADPDTIRIRKKREGEDDMSISIKPLEDRIVVQTVEAEQTTASGLVIPDTAKETSTTFAMTGSVSSTPCTTRRSP